MTENNENGSDESKFIPPQPKGSFRVVLEVPVGRPRIDATLLAALKLQSKSLDLKIISRSALKELFDKSRIQIKGQRAKSSSTLATGKTYVDILGYGEGEL